MSSQSKKKALRTVAVTLALFATAEPALPQSAEPGYVIGSSSAMTGFVATVDRAWVDGMRIAIDNLNQSGGLLGKKITLVVEDNRSQAQEGVTSYRKMMQSDRVNAFVSGCVSAAAFAAAPVVVRQQIPMILCSILPKDANLVLWMFTMTPLARFEVETHLAFLRDKTNIRNFGILYAQSPYAGLQANIAKNEAERFGLKVAGAEQFNENDVDLSIQIGKLHAAGARAILKMSAGPSTLTTAKNMKQLALDIPLLIGTEDLSMIREAANILGSNVYFVAGQSQIYDALPAGDPTKEAVEKFLVPWRQKYGDRDPFWAGRGYDGVLVLAEAVRRAKSFDGQKVRDALDTISGFRGTSGVYNFDKDHNGVTENPYVLAQFLNGKVVIVK